jgi:hypothetical protein
MITSNELKPFEEHGHGAKETTNDNDEWTSKKMTLMKLMEMDETVEWVIGW